MSHQNRKILLIDNDPYLVSRLERELSEHGYKVYTSDEGIDAIEKAMIFKPEIILMDVTNNGMNGIETCVRLRRNDLFNKTIIAFHTTVIDDAYQILCFEAGADDYIRKPIRVNLLVHRLNALYKRVS